MPLVENETVSELCKEEVARIATYSKSVNKTATEYIMNR